MKITVNKICEDEGLETTRTIENIFNSANRVLFIKDERDTNDYDIEKAEMATLKFYPVLKRLNEDKVVITPTKFTLLSWQGFMDCSKFDIVVIRLIDLKPEFIHAFRVFYFKTSLMSLENPKVITFLKDIKDGSHVYLQSIIDENYISKTTKEQSGNTIRCVSCIPHISRDVLNYLKVKEIIKKKKGIIGGLNNLDEQLTSLERKSFTEAVRYINNHLDSSKLPDVELSEESLDLGRTLLRKDEHMKIIEGHLKEGNVVVHSESLEFEDCPNIFVLKRTKRDKLRDISTLSTLIVCGSIQKNPNCENCLFNEHFMNLGYNVPTESSSLNDDVNIEPIEVNIIAEESLGIPESEEGKLCFPHEVINMRFKNVIYIKDEEEYPVDFIRYVMMSNKKDLRGFIKYFAKERDEYITHIKGAIIAKDFSVYFMEHILYLITRCFERHFLFFNSPKVMRSYENDDKGSYICILELPRFSDTDVFNMKIRSKANVLKKEACKEASYLALIKLHENGFLDDNLCPVDELFINRNPLYFERIYTQYGIESKDLKEIYKQIKEMISHYGEDFNVAAEKFKKKNYIDLKEVVKSNVSIEDILRKQPSCFKMFGEEYAIYRFNNGDVGLACSGGFEESLIFKSITIDYIETRAFSERERELLVFYQIIFFSINFKRIITIESKGREYCYFMLPMNERSINFEYIESLYSRFLLGCVYDVKDEKVLSSYLLFNPIGRTFHNYLGPSTLKLTDFIKSTHYSRMSLVSKKGMGEEHPFIEENNSSLTNRIMKIKPNTEKDPEETIFVEDSTERKRKTRSEKFIYYDYFKKIYGVELFKFINDRNIIINASVFSSKDRQKSAEVHSGEVLFVTGVRDTIKKDYQNFLVYFNIFEHCALANEFKQEKNLNVSLEGIANALSQSEMTVDNKTDLGYERLEFIGDCVLKFSISKFLITTGGYDLSTIVSTKDDLINNSYLYTVAQEMELNKYVSLIKFSENIFQPPDIKKCSELRDKKNKLNKYIEVLKGWGAFKSNNQEYFASRYNQKQVSEGKNIMGKKVYADIIEALIGVHYVEEGFDSAWEYIEKIGIPDLLSKEGVGSSDGKEDKLPNIGRINKQERGGPREEFHLKSEIADVLNILGYKKGVDTSFQTLEQERSYLICSYDNVLPPQKAKQIEKIIGYKFKNKGLLEKAVIHPSFKDNIFGSEKFQKLELVGDSFLDLKVSDYIYKAYTEATPYELHTLRKSLVNNHTFAVILFKSGLSDLIETGLNAKPSDFTKQKVSKAYSDIFEAIAGAVLLDNDFCLEKTHDFFLKMLVLMKENARDC